MAIGSRLVKESKPRAVFSAILFRAATTSYCAAIRAQTLAMRNAVLKLYAPMFSVLLAPSIQDNEWFFDTELLLLAQNCGLRLKSNPCVLG